MEDIDTELFVNSARSSEIPDAILAPYNAHDVCFKARRRHTQPASSFEALRGLVSIGRGRKLLRAAGYNDIDNVKKILEEGRVDPNTKDEYGRTALHVAAARGYAEVIRALLEGGADPNAEDKLGNTPLHLAIYTGCVDTVFYLLQGGCQPRKTTKLPYTPLQLVQSKLRMMEKDRRQNDLVLRQQALVSLLQNANAMGLLNRLSAEACKQEIDLLLKGVANVTLSDSNQNSVSSNSASSPGLYSPL